MSSLNERAAQLGLTTSSTMGETQPPVMPTRSVPSADSSQTVSSEPNEFFIQNKLPIETSKVIKPPDEKKDVLQRAEQDQSTQKQLTSIENPKQEHKKEKSIEKPSTCAS